MATANAPPSAPTVEDPTEGKANIVYQFTFCATDPDNDDLKYFVEWDDTHTTGWTTCYHPGEAVVLEHMYDQAGTFTIRTRAQECPNGAIGPDGTHTITLTKSKHYFNIPYLNFLQNHPHMIPILRQLLGF